MWTTKCTLISFWNVIFISFSLSQANAKEHSYGHSSYGLKLPCDPLRAEIAFPIIDDSNGRRTSEFYTEPSPRDLLHVTLKWRRHPLNLILYKNVLTSPESFSEWQDENITYAKMIDRSCHYHGYVKGQRTSYVALSTCGGLAGYIQTDTELLFVQSRLDIDSHQRYDPHLVYTCESTERVPESSHRKSSAGVMGKRRRRRAATRTKYLEVQLVLDHGFVRSVGGKQKAENYVLALLNIVNTVYQHSSLGQDIRVVVIRIIYLNQNQQRDVLTRGYALRTVNKFCHWSMSNIPSGSRMNYDISVLITDESLGPSGFAPITGLCHPVRSCAAIHDDGFTTGFVIAHEMAHVFGLFHDGHGNNCYGGKYRTSLMAPVVESKFNHFWWSDCSKRKMAEIVRYLTCLNNMPIPIAGHYPLKATQKIQQDLGNPWSLNFQCEREFGSPFQLCKAFGTDPCHVLWCASRHNPHYCRTKRGPPLSGSKCGRDMECHNNRCQYVGNRQPLNGHWSSWTRWSDCSSGCGVGTKERSRSCNNPPPQYGGDECEGESSMRDTCFNEECNKFEDMRAQECRVWDDLQIRYGTHKWFPFEPVNASTICKQTCKSFYTREVVTIEIDVSDGTPCSYVKNSSDVCIEGKCLAVGCDGVQNSTKRRDACGMCGGDSSECKVIEDMFKIRPNTDQKYLKVVTLPVNARNITLTKLSSTESFLAIHDPLYGTYLINGDKRQSRSEDLVMKGAMFYYKRGSSSQNETLTSPGPIHGPLEVMVYYKRGRKDIDVLFRYTVQKSDNTYEKDRYRWKFDKWSQCSVTCGEGIQKIMHNCIEKQTEKVVDKEKCSALKGPRKDEVKCIRQKCSDVRFNFVMLNTFSECDAKCGEMGYQTQDYMCEQHFPQTKKYTKAEMKYCSHLEAPKQKKKCKGDPCQNEERVTYGWNIAGVWSKCDSVKECGLPGHKTRTVQCITIRGSKKMENEVVEDSKCNKTTKPAETQMCPGVPCPDKYQWYTDPNWSECPCGGENTQTRKVVCQHVKEINGFQKAKSVEARFCRKQGPRPSKSRACDGGPCPPTFQWVYSDTDFEECNAECGETGKEIAKVSCQQVVVWKKDEIIETVDGSFCKSEKKPKEQSRVCTRPPCVPVYRWKVTDEWTKCGAKCDEESVQSRIYQCQKSLKNEPFWDVEENLCANVKKDNETKTCKGPLCPLEWQIGEWSECSVTCGRGKKFRTVYCGDPEIDDDDVRCTEDPPRMSKGCRLKWCPEPESGECKNIYSFCSFYSELENRCKVDSFQKKCCKTCQPFTKKPAARPKSRTKRTFKRKKPVRKANKKKKSKRSLKLKMRRSRRTRNFRNKRKSS